MCLFYLRRQLSVAWLLCGVTLGAENNGQHALGSDSHRAQPSISFSAHWQLLGPFQIGTREAIWGADPLEQFGGFPRLNFSSEGTYPSSLAPNASVNWDEIHFDASCDEGSALVKLRVDHANIDWASQQNIYGWAALQYQTWTRGVLVNPDLLTVRVLLYTTNILEVWVNDQHQFGGDFYGFERAPIVVDLVPGNNIISVRLIRDVRANGGQLPPSIEATLQAIVPNEQLAVLQNSILIPDVVDGKFVSSYGRVIISNVDDDWITVSLIEALSLDITQATASDIRIAPGQSRPLSFQLDQFSSFDLPTKAMIQYSVGGQKAKHLQFEIEITQRNRHDPQRITFLHPSGAVSYAVLRPPSRFVCDQTHQELPILLALHGAGLEADSYLVRHSFDAVPDLPAWLLFPTGMSPWSSDDWHTWGLSDVEAAVKAVPEWISTNGWSGPKAVIDNYVVCGHSNGGQGAWHITLHQPDRVIAAAVASGYTSIENYVPYVMWDTTDPRLDAILYSARISCKHELFFPNIATTPILIQHGQNDDNVPSYHGRLMKTLASRNRAKVKYVEVPNKGHWWDEVMVTTSMLEFYDEHLTLPKEPSQAPGAFNCVVGASHGFGPCKGIVVDQIQYPDTLANIRVTATHSLNKTIWYMMTSNVHRFHLDFSVSKIAPPDAIRVDDNSTTFEVGDSRDDTFKIGRDGGWMRDEDENWQSGEERSGNQRGAMDAILRTRGSFQIVYDSSTSLSVALQISRNLLQYYGAAADLKAISDYRQSREMSGNVIILSIGSGLPHAQLAGFPIQEQGSIQIRQRESLEYHRVEEATGAAFLRPLPNQRLELVVWGSDEAGLRQAARMVPTLTGAGQPDFVVFGPSARWEGVGGVVAMGFFDYSWNISSTSYLP